MSDTRKNIFNREIIANVWLRKTIYLLYLLTIIFFVGILSLSRTGDFILSPWEKIPNIGLFVVFFIFLFTILFCFMIRSTRIFLACAVLTTIALHLYMPLVYQTGFGGDKWRHIAAERFLVQGNEYQPTLFGDKAIYKTIGLARVPEVLIAGNKTSYSSFWGINIAAHWLTGIDIFYLDLLFGLLLFSIFAPIFLWRIGAHFVDDSFGRLMSIVPLIFFPFQLYGALSLPTSFGFLFFLFFFSILVYYYQERVSRKKKLFLLGSIAFFGYFNYILYPILLFLFFICAVSERNKSTLSFPSEQANTGLLPFIWHESAIRSDNFFQRIKLLFSRRRFFVHTTTVVVCATLISISLPFFDTMTGSRFIQNRQQIDRPTAREIINKLIFFDPLFERYANLEQDGYVFGQIDEQFGEPYFLKFISRDWIDGNGWKALGVVVLLAVLYGLYRARKNKNNLIFSSAIILLLLLIGQIIAAYFMEGNHLLTKRAVMAISFLFALVVSYGAYELIKNYKSGIAAFLILTPLIGTVAYASGPKMNVVTAEEMAMARYLMTVNTNQEPLRCVIGSTWPLLALEAESAKQIEAGGFPLHFEYRQPERVTIFNNLNVNPSRRDSELAREITNAQICFFWTEKRWMRKDSLEKITALFGEPIKVIGSNYLWRYGP
ncbi:MAG: hypothetical protein HYW78_01960 [Parcubacteria group bacterium]|nr:hypothetical protein [Parcubacteria group bacterium]